MPWCDTDAMAAHLIEISAAVDPGAHAVLIVDRPVVAIPETSPRAAATIARVEPGGECLAIHARQLVVEPDLKSYEDIVALCCQAWNNLIDQP